MSRNETNNTSAEEVKKGRGRSAMTEQEKAEKLAQFNLFHGTGEHTLSVALKVSKEERAKLRSFAKSYGNYFPSDLFAGLLRKFAFGNEFPESANSGDRFFELARSVANYSETVNNRALDYDKENGSGTISALIKKVEALALVKTKFANAGNTDNPKFTQLCDAIDLVMANIDILRSMDETEETEETEDDNNDED